MIISQEQSELNAAQPLISKSELKRIRLRQCHAPLEGEESSLKGPFSLAQTHTSRANAVMGRLLRIEVSFHFQSFDASENKAELFSIQCSFDLDYELEEGYQPPAEAIESFKNGNAIFNCWPYARECVQSITNRMGTNPPPLPLLRMVPKKAEPKIVAKTSPESLQPSTVPKT